MFGSAVTCGEVLQCLNFNRAWFHMFGCENCNVKADFRLSYFTFAGIEDQAILCCYIH